MLLLLLLSNAFAHLLAYHSGAPESTCVSMAPSHGNAIFQASNSTISISPACYTPNVPLTLTISGGQFKGFLFMVRPANGSTNGIGVISATDINTKTLNCGGKQTALTHTSSSRKQIINFIWTPPSDFNKTVIARLTVLTDYSTFWFRETAMNICVSTNPTTQPTSPTTAKTDLTTTTTKPVSVGSTSTTLTTSPTTSTTTPTTKPIVVVSTPTNPTTSPTTAKTDLTTTTTKPVAVGSTPTIFTTSSTTSKTDLSTTTTKPIAVVSTPTTPTSTRTTAKTDLTTPTTKPVATVSTATVTTTTASTSHVTTFTTMTTKSSTKMANSSTLTAYTKVITSKPSSAGVLVGSIWLSIVLSLMILAK